MMHRYLAHTIFVLLLFAAGQAQAQKWYTADVARELGMEPCEDCGIGRIREEINSVQVGSGRITPVTIAYFDTIACYAQGRVVDTTTGQPIKNAIIEVQFSCLEECDYKAAATNEFGFFRLGWIGCHGPKGNRANYPLLIRAIGYQTIDTEAVELGGSAYLHVELGVARQQH